MTFDDLERDHAIRYDVIADTYREASERYESRRNLADVLAEMLLQHGFVSVPAGADDTKRYFDTKTKTVVLV